MRFATSSGDGIVFDIHQGTTYECLRGLRDGKFDVAFCGKLSNEPDISFTPMLTQNLVLGLHESHPLASRSMVSLEELHDYDLASYRSESYIRARVDHLFTPAGLEVKESFNDEISAASPVTAEKNTVAIMLNTLDDGFTDGFMHIPIKEALEPFHVIYLATMRGSSHNSAAEQLRDFAAGYIGYAPDTKVLEDLM